MWAFRFQNMRRLTCEMSTIFVLREMGVWGFSRSTHSDDRGWTNLVRFSYNANRRNSLGGVFPSVLALL